MLIRSTCLLTLFILTVIQPLAMAAAITSPHAEAPKPDLCVFLGNHWSYTGVGWSYGLKSCVQSIHNSLEMADYSPSVKTGINLDAAAYPLVAEHHPEVIERLKAYLSAGKVEIIGGTYGQPMGSAVSGESNVRQLIMGQQTICEILGTTVSAFLEEEEFTHPQMPQLLVGAGYSFASAAQCDTWGKHGSPRLSLNAFHWLGIDGTSILTTPANELVFHPPVVTHDIDWLWSSAGHEKIRTLAKRGVPLGLKWVEFGWGPGELEGNTANRFFASKFRDLSAQFNVRYTTLTEFLQQFGDQATERIQWRMDDFNKLQPWGCGGDQLRRILREVEAILTTAERFDAAAQLLGSAPSREADLESAWKNLLVAQSHDVALCEYLDDGIEYAGINDPIARQFLASSGSAEENATVKTWGDMGFRHLRVARNKADSVLSSSLMAIAAQIDTAIAGPYHAALVVFNPCGSARTFTVTVRGSPRITDGKWVVVDDTGRPVPTQIATSQSGDESPSADLLFTANNLPAFGYATYYLAEQKEIRSDSGTELTTSEVGWKLENDFVSVELDPLSGAIARLVDRRSGFSVLNETTGAFPIFSGQPNREILPLRNVPERYDSSSARAEIKWVERGPVRATVKVAQTSPALRLEYTVTLHAGSPQVDVRIHVASDLPPVKTAERVNGWQLPLHIADGYWFSLVANFTPTTVLRDFPFGVEQCNKDAIDSLSFVDFVGSDGGLLLVHSGTQYFKRTGEKVFANLAMRDWHGIFMQKSGWPRKAEYRFALIPHDSDFNNSDRLR